MNNYPKSTDLLNQDPEAFDQYFSITERESRAHNARLNRIQNFWQDWPKQEAKNRALKHRLEKLKR